MAGSVQALTGRLHKIQLFPFAQSEIEGTVPDLLTKLIEDPAGAVSSKRTRPSKQPVFDTRESYIKRILYGGFPLAVTRAERPRNRWFDDYIRQTVERDIPGIARIRNKRGLLQLLRRLASQTAQILSVESAAKDAAVDVATARDYIQLLEDVFMIYKLPSWGRTLGSRITAKPKIHVLDSGIAARLLGLSSEKLSAKEPAALTEFGHLIETFTVAEILKELSWLDDSFLTGHWRTHGGDEVDFVVEKMDGSVYGFEIKSSGRAAGDVFDGLTALRKFAGSSFKGGFVFYTGTQSFRADDRLFALPVCSLWRA